MLGLLTSYPAFETRWNHAEIAMFLHLPADDYARQREVKGICEEAISVFGVPLNSRSHSPFERLQSSLDRKPMHLLISY
jgi:hypothetical protein